MPVKVSVLLLLRVDRIAATADVNKSKIFSYFVSKDDLFGTVSITATARAIEGVPFAAEDLPGYAVQLQGSFEKSPDTVRLPPP